MTKRERLLSISARELLLRQSCNIQREPEREESFSGPEYGFVICCRVSGGVTGTREALLKENGRVKHFPTREEAQQEATRLTESASRTFHSGGAEFRYWVEED